MSGLQGAVVVLLLLLSCRAPAPLHQSCYTPACLLHCARHLGPLIRSAVNATVSLLEAVMLSMPKRYNPRAPAVAQEAQLALLHTCCDLLRACGAAAPWISMDEQDRLLVTTAGLHCAVAYTPGLAAAAQAAASTGSHAAAAAFTNTLCSLLQLCTASITAAQDLLVEAEVTHLDDLAKLAAPGVAAELPRSRKLAACLAAAVELAQALGRNAATGEWLGY